MSAVVPILSSGGMKPTYTLDLINGVPSDMTFTRTSSAHVFGSNGLLNSVGNNVPRLEYDPSTGAFLGLLMEGAMTNMTSYSEQFDNAYWDKGGGLTAITANAAISPRGDLTADLLTEVAGTGSHHIHDLTGFTVTLNGYYAMSIFVKRPATAADRYVQLAFTSTVFGANAFVNFDLVNKTYNTLAGTTILSTRIQDCGNGWLRLSAVAQATAGTLNSVVQLIFVSSLTAVRAESYTVSPGSEEGVYIWGAQFEDVQNASGAASSYFTVTSAPAARAAETCVTASLPSWFNPVQGTLVVEGTAAPGIPNSASAQGFAGFDDGTTANRMVAFRSAASSPRMFFAVGGFAQADIVGANNSWPLLTQRKMALAYKANYFVLASANAIDGTDGVGNVWGTALTRFFIGYPAGVNSYGWTRRISYFNKFIGVVQLPPLTR